MTKRAVANPLALAVLVATPGVAQERALTADGQNFIMQRMERQNIQAFDRQAHRPISHARVCSATAEVGKTYLGKVVRLVDFGAFVEIFPCTDGLLHISEIAENRIRDVRDELKEGDQILVKVLALEGNKIKLSRKAVLREQREKLKQGKH